MSNTELCSDDTCVPFMRNEVRSRPVTSKVLMGLLLRCNVRNGFALVPRVALGNQLESKLVSRLSLSSRVRSFVNGCRKFAPVKAELSRELPLR